MSAGPEQIVTRSAWLLTLGKVPLLRRLLPLVEKVGASFIDTGLASAQNLFSVFLIGAIYGIETLGQFSILLIYSSFIFLLIYNFVVVPATSKDWVDEDGSFASVACRIGVVVTAIATILAALLDTYFLEFVKGDLAISFVFVATYSIFLGLRRIVLHYRDFALPSLSPVIFLAAFGLASLFTEIGYTTLLAGWSLSLSLPFIVVLARFIGGQPAGHVSLGRQFFAFSRWMAFGIWFQWLSGNLIQILVQQNLGDEGLGQLRILLSSFGFMSIYFQHREIVLARNLIAAKASLTTAAIGGALRSYAVPVTLVAVCFPIYLAYCETIGTKFYLDIALIYGLYQLLVLISVEKRVRLRVLGDMSFTTCGYIAMVISILVMFRALPSFDLMMASWLYLISMTLMVGILFVGEVIVMNIKRA